jgi:hypothetical protein
MRAPTTDAFDPKAITYLFDTHVGNYRVMTTDDLTESISRSIAAGDVSGHSFVNKFGRNPSIGTTAEDIWGYGGDWAAPLSGVRHTVKSTSNQDSPTGSGAWTVSINGLNERFVDTTETMTLSGLNDVPTVNKYSILHRFMVLTAGSGAANQGQLTSTASGGGNVVSIQITAGLNQSTHGIYQIPSGYTAYMLGYCMGMQNVGAGPSYIASFDGQIYAKPPGGVFNLKQDIPLTNVGASYIERHLDNAPLKFTEMTTIKGRGVSNAGTSDVNFNFDLLLVKN